MTVGELIDAIAQIKELERDIEKVMDEADTYINPGKKVEELEQLIGIYRSRDIE